MTAQEFISKYKEYLYDSDKQAAFDRDVMQLVDDTLKRAYQWLKDHVQIPYSVETDEKGMPLAESFFEHAQRRCEVADEIGAKFLRDMIEHKY